MADRMTQSQLIKELAEKMGLTSKQAKEFIGAYAEMCEQAREEAFDLLVQHATARGANAIVGLAYDASDLGGHHRSATEVLCYGTAVVIEPVA